MKRFNVEELVMIMSMCNRLEINDTETEQQSKFEKASGESFPLKELAKRKVGFAYCPDIDTLRIVL